MSPSSSSSSNDGSISSSICIRNALSLPALLGELKLTTAVRKLTTARRADLQPVANLSLCRGSMHFRPWLDQVDQLSESKRGCSSACIPNPSYLPPRPPPLGSRSSLRVCSKSGKHQWQQSKRPNGASQMLVERGRGGGKGW